MLDTFRNAWKISDLRKKIFFTIFMLLVFRLGSHIPVPGMNAARLQDLMRRGGAIFGFFDIVSGGSFANATIFAMSITPYINASIIVQLLTVAIPKFEQLSKEGEEGRKIIAQIIRYTTVVLAFVQAVGLTIGMRSSIYGGLNVLSFITVTLSFTAGTAFLMWLGEQITEKGIGNGISMLIFAGIVSRAPVGALAIVQNFRAGKFGQGAMAYLAISVVLAVFVAIIALVIWVQEAERRIPVQYAKRVVGRKMYGGQSTHIPIKVNLAGVMPIIFAMSFVALPSTIISVFAPNSQNKILVWFRNAQTSILFALLTGVLIIFFTFFYSYIQFNPIEIANNMKKNGGFIPGIRPGKPTSEYISKILNRVTWFGAIFLAIIQLFPSIVGKLTHINGVWFAGTSVLILVNVALDTVKQIESQMIMRHYKGFLG
ncbi:MAG: preprotein translocase subunit SecY [Clostridiales bacterium]|nr:preprotein translocase subunit SecY [Clostridiales bacterium]